MEQERYSRQVALPGFGAPAQALLASARVLVIGAGGLGSSVIPSLAAAGVGTIGIIDDDRVETSNLHRQLIHGVADVGSTKVASAAASVAALNPDTTVIGYAERLTAQNALQLMRNYDVVVDGSDNFPTRYIANDAAQIAGIPLVWGAVSQYGGQASVSWAKRGPTYRDLFPTPPPPGAVLSCAVDGVLPTVVATVGSLLATEVIKVITGIGTPLIGRVSLVDALTGSFRELGYERDPEAAPVTGLIDYELFCGMAKSLTPAELAARADSFTLLDVREPWEAAIASLPGAVLVPLALLEDAVDELDSTLPVVVYCHHGIRSAIARDTLEAHGFSASHLAGGIDAWARDIDSTLARY